jgi:hypothetical protein
MPPATTCPTAEVICCQEARDCISKTKAIEGMVVSAKYAPKERGQPTFLNLCYKYPDERRFTLLIWGENRQQFVDCLGGPPEELLLNHKVSARGHIQLYEGVPEIILDNCIQLAVLEN